MELLGLKIGVRVALVDTAEQCSSVVVPVRTHQQSFFTSSMTFGIARFLSYKKLWVGASWYLLADFNLCLFP